MIGISGRAVAGVLTALAISLGGCANEGSSVASGSRPNVAPSVLPSALPAPSPSAIVKVRSQPGAQAFVRYWFATLDYATQTGDISRLTAASDTSCQPCEDAIGVVRNSYSDGGYLQGGTYTLRSVSPEAFAPADRPMMTVSYDRSARSSFSPDAQVRGSDAPLTFASAQVTVEWLGGGWKVTTIVGDPLPS